MGLFRAVCSGNSNTRGIDFRQSRAAIAHEVRAGILYRFGVALSVCNGFDLTRRENPQVRLCMQLFAVKQRGDLAHLFE